MRVGLLGVRTHGLNRRSWMHMGAEKLVMEQCAVGCWGMKLARAGAWRYGGSLGEDLALTGMTRPLFST